MIDRQIEIQEQREIKCYEAPLLVKPDAQEDGCVPTLLEMLVGNGMLIGGLYVVELDINDGMFLYTDDIEHAQTEEELGYRMAGAQNLVGRNLVLTVTTKDLTNPELLLRRLKGYSDDPIGRRTIRGRLAFPLPPRDELTEAEYLAKVVRSRIHFHRDDREKEVFYSLLIRKGFYVEA